MPFSYLQPSLDVAMLPLVGVSEPDLGTLGWAIRQRRRAVKLTGTQLAEAAGVAQGDISKYERNKQRPNPLLLKRIALALSCTTDDLLRDVNPATRRSRKVLSSANSPRGENASKLPQNQPIDPIRHKGVAESDTQAYISSDIHDPLDGGLPDVADRRPLPVTLEDIGHELIEAVLALRHIFSAAVPYFDRLSGIGERMVESRAAMELAAPPPTGGRRSRQPAHRAPVRKRS